MEYLKLAAAAYLIIINIIGWVLPMIDKKKARSGEWRIPEKTLFAVAALGGSAAMLISMKKHRHKTLHKRFMIGIPCIILLQLAAASAAVYLYLTQA